MSDSIKWALEISKRLAKKGVNVEIVTSRIRFMNFFKIFRANKCEVQDYN